MSSALCADEVELLSSSLLHLQAVPSKEALARLLQDAWECRQQGWTRERLLRVREELGLAEEESAQARRPRARLHCARDELLTLCDSSSRRCDASSRLLSPSASRTRACWRGRSQSRSHENCAPGSSPLSPLRCLAGEKRAWLRLSPYLAC